MKSIASAVERTAVALAMCCLAAATTFALSASPAAVLAGLGAIVIAGVVIGRPEVGALLILVLVAIVPRGILFDRGIPFAGGNLKITDVLLVLTLGAWIIGRTLQPDRFPLPSRSVTALILTLLALAAVGLMTARSLGTPRKLSLLELRPLLSYLLVFPLVSGGRSWRTVDRGLALMALAAGASACVAIGEYVRGVGTVATFAGGALRVQAVVFLYPLLALVWAPVVLAYAPARRLRSAMLCLAALSLGGIFFTFARGAWLALLISIPMILVLLPARRRTRAVSWLVPLLVVGVFGVLALNAVSSHGIRDPLGAGLQRITSVGAYRNDVSSRYRLAEWSQALDEIERHPLTGIGLGSSITFTNPMFSPEYNSYGYTFSTYYIHSSYVWFALKLGIVGALVFFALVGRVWWRAYRGYRKSRDPRVRMVLLGALGSLTALLVLSTNGPHLNVDNATPAVAALIAAVEIARRLGATDGQAGTA